MIRKSNAKTEAKKLSPAKDLSDRELDMVVGGLNPQPLPPRRFSF